MSATVRIPTILRTYTGGVGEVSADGSTLAEVLDSLEDNHPGIRARILDDSGALRRFVNVYVGDDDVRFIGGLDAQVAEGTKISIIPAVAGGAQRLAGAAARRNVGHGPRAFRHCSRQRRHLPARGRGAAQRAQDQSLDVVHLSADRRAGAQCHGPGVRDQRSGRGAGLPRPSRARTTAGRMRRARRFHRGLNAEQIFGGIDAIKLRSSMTLFAPPIPIKRSSNRSSTSISRAQIRRQSVEINARLADLPCIAHSSK